MTKDKSSASFEEALSYVVDFYNLHGHVVKKVRFDAGSTENSLSSAIFLASNRIDIDPAAVKSQFQNPVEREVQTINKARSSGSPHRSVSSRPLLLVLCR
jgi:hypothetical protein